MKLENTLFLFFTLTDVDKVTLPFAAHPLREQVSVIYVLARHSGY